MPMPSFSGSYTSSDKLAADMKSFADLGNAFSSPFAVGRAASASGEASRETSQGEASGAAATSYVVPALIVGGVLLLAVVLYKKL